MLPDRVRQLQVDVAGDPAGLLTRESQYLFTYARDDDAQAAVSLLMPPTALTYAHGDLFPSMDMNLPEGFLFQRILERYPKRTLTKMHLLALMGDNGIGRAGFWLERTKRPVPATLNRNELLATTAGPALFDELVDAYLSLSAGVSGVQPKLLIPSKGVVPIPDLIVKLAGADYPNLTANEYLCLDAARHAGIAVPRFDLSADGSLLVIDRFDLDPTGRRVGFEDAAALMGRQVHDRLSNRKYEGSYQRLAEAIGMFSSQVPEDLERFYEQFVLSVMVRNGDAHLKNFGMLYTTAGDAQLAPMFDVATTTIYRYQRPGGAEAVDRTMALKLRSGKKGNRSYPDATELLTFGRDICGVRKPRQVLERIAQGMGEALVAAAGDDRIDARMLKGLRAEWEAGRAMTLGIQ